MTASPTPEGRPRIVVLGGYGAVGAAVSEALAGWFPGRVVVAGRDGGRAAALAARLGGEADAQQVDVGRAEDVRRVLDGAGVAVMCVERANVQVARACLERGVDYVDVTATPAVVRSIADLDGQAAQRGATAALSVGLAPGVTNLLARLCHDRAPEATGIDLTLCFGLGGDHGADSRRWILDGLATSASWARRRRRARVRLPGLGTRTAYPFPFSDQETLAAGLGIPVTTRLCFDSRVATATIFALRPLRVLSVLRRARATDLIEAVLSRVHTGSDAFAIQAVADVGRGRSVACTATGTGECRTTGIVAAHVARRLVDGTGPAGVHHIDALVDPRSFLDDLGPDTLTVEVRP